MKYLNHDYEINFCDPSQDWGKAKGLFRIDSAAGDTGKYYETYKEADEAAKRKIEEFAASIPSTEKEWVKAIEHCMIWTDYESCHIDEEMALSVLRKANKYFDK